MSNRSEPIVRSTSGPAVESSATTPMPDDAVALLANPRRRHAVRYLIEFSYPVSLRTLAAHVVAAKEDVPHDAIFEERVEHAAITLHHVDLPELLAAGLVDYDPESRLAVRTAAGERAVAAAGLESLTEED